MEMIIELWNQLHPTIQTLLTFAFGLTGIYFMVYSFFFYYKMIFKRDEYLAEQKEKYQKLFEQSNQIYKNKIARSKP